MCKLSYSHTIISPHGVCSAHRLYALLYEPEPISAPGYLSPPDVTYVMEPHSVRFSWSAPFSLNITDYEPDILYYVVNITVDDETRSTMNTTDTVFHMLPDLCVFSEYTVKIAAVNIVGVGEKYASPPLHLEGI